MSKNPQMVLGNDELDGSSSFKVLFTFGALAATHVLFIGLAILFA